MTGMSSMDKVNVEVRLPWAAWYEDTVHVLTLPERWQVDTLEPEPAPAWSVRQIEAALNDPIESPPLTELARQGRSACLVVDDLARPTKATDVLPKLIDQLCEGGISSEAITVLVATGTHGLPDKRQIAWKVGVETAAVCRVEVHDAAAALASTGITYGRQELRINRSFLEADVKVGVGAVLPHSFAGYSGGAKLMLPGLADVDATARSHKFVQMGLRGGRDPDQNRFRLEIERLARELGFRYTVCVVPNGRRETAGVFAGDLVAAHRRACEAAAGFYATPLRATYDCLLLNAYPKDVDLIQAENVLVSLKTTNTPAVRDGGVLLITTAAAEGLGRHGLFAPGGASYREPRPKRALGNREVWLYAPNVDRRDARKIHCREYPFFPNARALLEGLAKRFPDYARVGVLPRAPMQQLEDRRADR